MNWFTRTHISHLSLAQKQSKIEEHGGCDHVEADASLAHVVMFENDSFGREGHVACKVCEDKADEEEGKEAVVCHDCKQDKEKKDTIEWKWYDFYAAQGDEPLIICDCCRGKEVHQNRVARDRAAYREEFPEDFDD